MKLDMHVHSEYSVDCRLSVRDILKTALSTGLSGICVADHNSSKGGIEAKKIAPNDFIVVPGSEVSSKEGHILCYGTYTEIPQNLGIQETIDKIHESGGIAVAAHPCRLKHSIGSDAIRKYRFDGVETFNTRNIVPYSNKKAEALANIYNCGMVGGSDAHILKHIGMGFTIIEDADDADDVVEAIRKRKTRIGGKTLSACDVLMDSGRAVREWVSREGRRI